MLNCLQVKNIIAGTPEELQEELNTTLVQLGKRVQSIDFVTPLAEGFAANVVFWSQDVPAAITQKIESAPLMDGAALFVAVITDEQRGYVEEALTDRILYLQQLICDDLAASVNAAERDNLEKRKQTCIELLHRFEKDVTLDEG